MVICVTVVAIVFCPPGNPRTLSPSASQLGWGPAAMLQAGYLFPQRPPLVPARAWGWSLLGYWGCLGSPATLVLLLQVSMLLRPWRLPEPVILTSPRAHFPGPAEGFSVFTGHIRRWGEGTIFAQQLLFHIIQWKSQDGEGSFCLDIEKFLFCLRYDLGTSFQIPGTEPCTPEP